VKKIKFLLTYGGDFLAKWRCTICKNIYEFDDFFNKETDELQCPYCGVMQKDKEKSIIEELLK
jgi:DNA-directed RNA polymerase subunit RPC12/RpoP